MINLFFSYSHKDEQMRNELDKHLSILKRQGIITSWHDRCIDAGSDFNAEISKNLKNADIVLLLISSDFIASDYCYDNEMKHAMEMHEQGKTIVIPVILRPCDWHGTPFGKLLATPTDGKAVAKFASYDDAFLDITDQIKRVISSIKKDTPIIEETKETITNEKKSQPRSSNLRITKKFSDQEKDKYLDDSFEYISNYFEGSLKELKIRNSYIDYRFKRVDSLTFTVSIYLGGKTVAECMIFYGAESFLSNGISYSSQISDSKNSYNESFTIADDGYILYLKPIGMSMSFGRSRDSELKEQMTNEGAAEYFWQLFIERLQRN